MQIAFIMLAVTLASNGSVVDYTPVTPHLYTKEKQCNDDIPSKMKYYTQFTAPDIQIVCGEVQRESEY